jgi:glutamyl-tRNA synthetase
MPRPGKTTFMDLVRSEVTFDHQHVDDFVILRSDRTPTYHLASTVDDVDYRISHVARGEDLLPSTPRHIQLTLALGGEVPVYAHLPLIMGTDGKRLSKRHGAQGITEYRQMGYLPEAIFNFVALMSWSIGDDITIFSPEQAVAAFDLGDVSSNPAVFDADKLLWLNGEYMRSLPVDDFSTRVRPFLEAGLDRPLADREWATFTKVAPVVQERVKLLSEAADQVRFLFVDDLDYDLESWSKVMTPESATVLGAARERLTDLMPFDKETVETALRGMLEELGMNAKKGLQPIRVAVTGSSVSPPLFESIAALGKERTLSRLTAAAARLTT